MERSPESGKRKTYPHHRIFEKTVQAVARLGFFDHCQGHLHQWKDQTLIDNPLSPQENHRGDHHQEAQIKGNQARKIGSQSAHGIGWGPPVPSIEEPGALRPVRHHPLGKVR
jgi:hypothetical protein